LKPQETLKFSEKSFGLKQTEPNKKTARCKLDFFIKFENLSYKNDPAISSKAAYIFGSTAAANGMPAQNCSI
jgi:hypothetical protein